METLLYTMLILGMTVGFVGWAWTFVEIYRENSALGLCYFFLPGPSKLFAVAGCACLNWRRLVKPLAVQMASFAILVMGSLSF